jgi:tetratricopeptide (TPR) repeat protein
MSRKLLLYSVITTFLLMGMNCFAQKKAESYKSLKKRSTRTEAEQLLQEAETLKYNNPDEALNKVQEALAMSIAQHDDFTEGRSYILLAEINEGIFVWKLAYENYLRAQEKLSAYSVTEEYIKTIKGLGNTSLELKNYDAALKYYEQGLSMRLSGTGQRELLIGKSEVYYQMGNYQEALKILETLRNPKGYDQQVENLITKVKVRMNEVDKPQNIYGNSLNTIRSGKSVSPKEQEAVQETKEEISDALQENKLYDEEIGLRKQSIEYNLETKNLAEVSKDKVAISKSLDAKGETSAAIKEAEEAASIADTINNPKEQANAFLSLATLYEKNGQPDKALNAFKKYSEAVSKNEKLNESMLTEKSELIRKQKDIEEYTKNVYIGQREETIEEETVFRQQLIIYGLLAIILIIAITSFFIFKNAQASKLANRLLALKSLRGQMNPHFIFNALNSVNQFISQQDERTANRFLSEFALLMRLVLEHSQEDFITLQKEQEILSLYLKLEHYRFRDKFDYEIKSDESINTEAIQIPPMLIQPYIENAVWHGLRYKDEKGKLSLHFYKQNGSLVAEITDDGIGRKRSAELKTENQKKHNSTGLKNIEERLAIINKVYKVSYRVVIEDRTDNSGTRVSVYMPINSKIKSYDESRNY